MISCIIFNVYNDRKLLDVNRVGFVIYYYKFGRSSKIYINNTSFLFEKLSTDGVYKIYQITKWTVLWIKNKQTTCNKQKKRCIMEEKMNFKKLRKSLFSIFQLVLRTEISRLKKKSVYIHQQTFLLFTFINIKHSVYVCTRLF